MKYVDDTWKPKGGIAITEFGFSEPYEQLRTLRPDILSDYIRSAYYDDYLKGLLISISEGINVIGVVGWAIYDNFEWYVSSRSDSTYVATTDICGI